jgi:hypothetical protein
VRGILKDGLPEPVFIHSVQTIDVGAARDALLLQLLELDAGRGLGLLVAVEQGLDRSQLFAQQRVAE